METELAITVESLKETCHRLENKLDYLIGFNYWKRYTASAFWSNLSTPFNLVITLLTAIMAAHTTSNGFISNDVNMKISIISLFITTLNTFFRPHAHSTENLKCLARWLEFGYKFERIYYQDLCLQDHAPTLQRKIEDYNKLLELIYTYKTEETSTQQNFVTDLLHIIVQQCCLYNLVCDGKGEGWLSNDLNKPKPKYCCISSCCGPPMNSSKASTNPQASSIELPKFHHETTSLYPINAI